MQPLKHIFTRGQQHDYLPLPASSGEPGDHARPPASRHPEKQAASSSQGFRRRSWLKYSAVAASLAVMMYLAVAFTRIFEAIGDESCESVPEGYTCQPGISRLWGQYSPFFSVPSEIDAALPQGCEITFAQVLSRHGARDPTSHSSQEYNATIGRLHRDVVWYGAGFEFIRDYRYAMGADQLTDFGRRQMRDSGANFYARYRALARGNTPFIRSAGQERVVESGANWGIGFHQARQADNGRPGADGFPYSMIVIPEDEGVNNTLSHGLCTAFESSTEGEKAKSAFQATFVSPIRDRLNANLPGAELTHAETIHLMEMCPFDTVSNTQDGQVSKFCGLFTSAEWADYDYLQSLGKYYGYGDGNPLGPTQGVGFANELISRLTGEPVSDHTTTNETLDLDPETFPLDRPLYADFSHDNDMAGMFAALGLYNFSSSPGRLLPRTERREPLEVGGYAASWVVPFASRMYVEKMKCSSKQGVEKKEKQEELVRILVNDRVVPLLNCGADALGRCTVDRFVESLAFARGGGFWDKCFS